MTDTPRSRKNRGRSLDRIVLQPATTQRLIAKIAGLQGINLPVAVAGSPGHGTAYLDQLIRSLFFVESGRNDLLIAVALAIPFSLSDLRTSLLRGSNGGIRPDVISPRNLEGR